MVSAFLASYTNKDSDGPVARTHPGATQRAASRSSSSAQLRSLPQHAPSSWPVQAVQAVQVLGGGPGGPGGCKDDPDLGLLVNRVFNNLGKCKLDMNKLFDIDFLVGHYQTTQQAPNHGQKI